MYKILIADDEELEREALRFFINESSLDIDQVIECASGTEVIKRVMLDRPDIIVLDINMPGLNGLQALEKIKSQDYRFGPCFPLLMTILSMQWRHCALGQWILW